MNISKFLPLIGVVLFIFLILNVDLSKVGESFLKINHYFILGMLIYWITVIMRAFRWKMIVNSYGIEFSIKDATKGWLTGFSIGLITPGKVGDLGRAYYLRGKENIGKSITTVVADRIFDIIILFILSVIGLTYFVMFYVDDLYLLIGTYMFFALFVFALIVFSKKEFSSFIIRPFYKRVVPENKKGKLKSVYDDFYTGVNLILKNKKMLAMVSFFTLIIWAMIIYYLLLFSEMLGLGASYTYFFMVFPIITLVLTLPISFSGLGTKDAAIIFFFSYIGIGPEAAISFSLIHLLSDYLIGVFGFLLWYKNPIKLGKSA